MRRFPFNCGPGPVCYSQPPDIYGSGRLYLPWALAAQAPGQAYLYGATDAGVPIPRVSYASPTGEPCAPWIVPRNPDPIGGDVVGGGVFQPKAPLPWDRPTLGPDHGRWAVPGYIAREPDQGWWVSEAKDEFSGARSWITNMVAGLGGLLGGTTPARSALVAPRSALAVPVSAAAFPGAQLPRRDVIPDVSYGYRVGPSGSTSPYPDPAYYRQTAARWGQYQRPFLGRRGVLGLGAFETPGSKVALVAGLAAVGVGLWYFLVQSKKAKKATTNRRRRNRYYTEVYGAGLIKHPTEESARASATRFAPKRGGWARVWEDVEPGAPMKLVGRYGTTKKGLTRRMNSGKQTLSSSGWVASWSGDKPNTIYLDYEGREFKRSQSVIRYGRGRYGWDFPEVVPGDVKRKLYALFERLHRSR